MHNPTTEEHEYQQLRVARKNTMAPFSTFFGAALLLASSVSAHYSLLIPKPLGTDDEQQGSGPCGGYTPDFSKNTVSDFHVGGSNVGMRLGHPQATWLFRGTLDKTGQNNWTQLFPHVTQSGLGNFCEPSIPAPESWAGKEGIIGVVGKAEDGLLFTVSCPNSRLPDRASLSYSAETRSHAHDWVIPRSLLDILCNPLTL